MKKVISISLSLMVLAAAVIACSLFTQRTQGPQPPLRGSGGDGGNRATQDPSESFGSEGSQPTIAAGVDPVNGEQIYFTASNKDGDRIRYTGGPNFGGMMMGAYLTCASCHGPNAHGGQHVMHMQTMYAPPIYYDALNSMMAEESGETLEPGGYTLEDFRIPVIEGEHPDGDQLDEDMPRWEMSEQDLADLFAFLKTLPP